MSDAATWTESCSLCGAELEYLERAADLVCSACGREEPGHVRCPQGHYLCETCHGGGVEPAIRERLRETTETVPTKIAADLFDLPELPMLGCEHALIAAGSLMAALRNRDIGVTEQHVEETLTRTKRQAVSAYCGLTGVCGVVPALGASYSVLVGGHCGKGPETRAAMELVSRLAAVTAAEAEPGCCKAYVGTALAATEVFLDERLGIPATERVPIVCTHAERHPHGCRGPACDFHPEHRNGQAVGTEAETTPTERGGPAMAPPESEHAERVGTASRAQQCYDDFFGLAYADGALDRKAKILVALGASLGAGCSP